MKRRNFLRNSFLSGAAMVTASQSFASEKNDRPEIDNKPFNLDYAFHDGMFKNNAGSDFLDQIRWAYDQGFRSVEDNGMMGRSVEQQQKIGDLLSKLGMKMGVFVVDKGGNGANSLAAGKQEYLEIFLSGCKRAVDTARRCNAKWMTVVPGDFARNLPIGLQTSNVIDALRKGADILQPHGLIMVLEPLSDTPDLFLRYSDQTYEICRAVNSPSCKILFDMYHMQRNEGNIIANINRVWDEVGYFQIGDNPGRKEPGTGEMNYKNIFKHINNKGYKGILGMEHGNALPGKDGEIALIKAYRDADSFK